MSGSPEVTDEAKAIGVDWLMVPSSMIFDVKILLQCAANMSDPSLEAFLAKSSAILGDLRKGAGSCCSGVELDSAGCSEVSVSLDTGLVGCGCCGVVVYHGDFIL